MLSLLQLLPLLLQSLLSCQQEKFHIFLYVDMFFCLLQLMTAIVSQRNICVALSTDLYYLLLDIFQLHHFRPFQHKELDHYESH